MRPFVPLLLCAWLLAPSACAKPAPPPPRPPVLWVHCDRIIDPRFAPRGIRVVNESTDSLAVWVDDCNGKTRVGDLHAGETRIFKLPARLVAFAGGLRFHMYRNANEKGYSSALLPFDRPLLELTVPAQGTPCERKVYLDGVAITSLRNVPHGRVLRVEMMLGPGIDVSCTPLNYVTKE